MERGRGTSHHGLLKRQRFGGRWERPYINMERNIASWITKKTVRWRTLGKALHKHGGQEQSIDHGLTKKNRKMEDVGKSLGPSGFIIGANDDDEVKWRMLGKAWVLVAL